ncbi:hypothetical protein BD410DRAFT_554953, partial [Rickenella mellea]
MQRFGNRTCKICSQVFKSKDKFDAHMWDTHKRKDCGECGHWSLSVDDEMEHKKKHQKTVSLEICGRTQRIQRGDDGFFQCVITWCNFRTESPDEAKSHHDNTHEIVKTMGLPARALPQAGSVYVPQEHTPTPTTSRVPADHTPAKKVTPSRKFASLSRPENVNRSVSPRVALSPPPRVAPSPPPPVAPSPPPRVAPSPPPRVAPSPPPRTAPPPPPPPSPPRASPSPPPAPPAPAPRSSSRVQKALPPQPVSPPRPASPQPSSPSPAYETLEIDDEDQN